MEINIFISYSHKDRSYKEDLEKHFSILKRMYRGVVKIWSDKELVSGDTLDLTIQNNLNNSNIVILLLSADFFNSYYCYENEFKPAYIERENGEKTIIPVVVRPCDWINDNNMANIVSATFEGKSISEYANVDIAYLEIVKEVHKIIKHILEKDEMDITAEITYTRNEIINETEDCVNSTISSYESNFQELCVKLLNPYKNTPDDVIDEIRKDIEKEDFVNNIDINLKYLLNKLYNCIEWKYFSIKIIELIYEEYTRSVEKVLQDFFNDSTNFSIDEVIIESYLLSFTTKFSRVLCLFHSIPKLYLLVSNINKILIYNKCLENINYYVYSYFLNEAGHFKKCIELLQMRRKRYIELHKWINVWEVPYISSSVIDAFNRNDTEYHEFIISLVKMSFSFTDSDALLKNVVLKRLKNFNTNDLKQLLFEMDSNYQFYAMGSGSDKYKKLDDYLREYREIIRKIVNDNDFINGLGNIHI